MGRYAKDSGGGNFIPAPAGNFAGRCIRLIDLGTQHSTYNGKPIARNQVFIQWELDEKMEDGQPFVVSAFMTNSLSEKSNMRPMLEAWRGRAFTPDELKSFDLQNILNAPGMVNVIHVQKDGKTKAYVSAVTKMPKGLSIGEPVNKPSSFWIEEWDQAAFDALPKGIRAIIEQSDEYKARKNGNGGGNFSDMEDDLPWDDNAPDNREQPPF